MVSVGLLFRGQVLLDVVVHALAPASVGDFHDTICKAKTIRIYIRYGELRFKGVSIRAEIEWVCLDVAEVFVRLVVQLRCGYCSLYFEAFFVRFIDDICNCTRKVQT